MLSKQLGPPHQELEHENSKLKRLYADMALENTALKDVLAKKL